MNRSGNLLEAEIDPWPFGQRALLVIAQEAAFVGDMVPGGQAMFGRVRIRVDGLQPLHHLIVSRIRTGAT